MPTTDAYDSGEGIVSVTGIDATYNTSETEDDYINNVENKDVKKKSLSMVGQQALIGHEDNPRVSPTRPELS